MRRATGQGVDLTLQGVISIHALREEGDFFTRREVTEHGNISIHALREEGDLGNEFLRILQDISIHALREEGDSSRPRWGLPPDKISIHALREEGDGYFQTEPKSVYLFLSTPSVRRATGHIALTNAWLFISIHALREEGDDGGSGKPPHTVISIHALREEGDFSKCRVQLSTKRFLSTPSVRRATAKTEKNISAFVSL